MLKTLILLLYGFTLLHGVSAQTPYLFFDKMTTQNGLSNNKVNAIIQDKRGFLWIGTEDGLNRYDGANFLVFRNSSGCQSCISGNIVTDIAEDSDGILWIGTADGGLTKYDYRRPPVEQFRQYRHDPDDSTSIPVNIINKIRKDGNRYLWLATSGNSVVRFDKQREVFEKVVRTGTKTALDIVEAPDGKLWVGRQGGGILKIDKKTLALETDRRYDDLYATLPHAAVTSLYADPDSVIWFGSWDKILYAYNLKTGVEKAYGKKAAYSFPGDEVNSFLEDGEGRIWMGTRRNGLVIFERRSGRFYNYVHDPSKEGTVADNQVNCIFRDNTGMIWIGTNKGVSIINKTQQQFVQRFLPFAEDEVAINDFFVDPQRNLWIGTTRGLFLRRHGSEEVQHIPIVHQGRQLSVSKIYPEQNGSFLLGTDLTLFIFDPSSHKVSMFPNPTQDLVMKKIIDSRIVSIVKDSILGEPVLLVSPYGHFLTYYDYKERRWVSRLDSSKKIIQSFNLKDNLIHKIYKTSDGNLWLATAKEGLGEWVENSMPRVRFHNNLPSQKNGLSNNHIYDLAEDSKGNMWIATYGGGLHYFERKIRKFSHIASANNLLEGLQIDRKGNVWMISDGDLHHYEVVSGTFTSFDLPDLEKSGGVRGYIYKDNAGKMYVGGRNYFIEFDPSRVTIDRVDPNVLLTDFRIFNTSYSNLLFGEKIQLKYNENYFTVEFAAPEFTPADVRYSYKLEGEDADWVDAGDRNFANYSNLDGGNYLFRVRATNSIGVWKTHAVPLRIVIVPPFWKTAWFYVACALATALIIYGIYRYRVNEILKRQSIRNKIAQDLHDNVGSTLSSVAVYSQVAQIQNEQGNREGLRNVLEKISGTSNEMISEMNDIVWAINPRNDSMGKIIQRMESFAKPLCSAAGIELKFHYHPAIGYLNLQMEARNNFYLIFKEAINNAIKYSRCKTITVDIEQRGGTIELQIADDGLGADMQQINQRRKESLGGNGLINMKRRAKDMKGQIDIHSSLGHGCAVRLRFPIT
jgi:streptogramin lyase/two-component sensor histidine kinase